MPKLPKRRKAHPINIGEICCSDEVTGIKKQRNGSRGAYGMKPGSCGMTPAGCL